MNRLDWQNLIATAPPGLSLAALARHLNQEYLQTRYWAKLFGYSWTDGRSLPHPGKYDHRRKLNPALADWSRTNLELAKQFNISRQRIWELRRKHQPCPNIPLTNSKPSDSESSPIALPESNPGT